MNHNGLLRRQILRREGGGIPKKGGAISRHEPKEGVGDFLCCGADAVLAREDNDCSKTQE